MNITFGSWLQASRYAVGYPIPCLVLSLFLLVLLTWAPSANAHDGFWDKARDALQKGEDAIQKGEDAIKAIGEEKAEPAGESPPAPDQGEPMPRSIPDGTAMNKPTAQAPLAISGAGQAGAGRDNDLRVLTGPRGRQLIEVAMPEAFEPIRLVGLNGLPVAGYPVSERTGELNPRNWEQLDTKSTDIDVSFVRLMQALHVRWQPKLLQGMTYAEDFARKHLDEQSSATFFPAGVRGSRATFGSNEFERKQLFEEFLRRHEGPLGQSLPATPFEFIYIERVRVDTYEEARQRFPLATREGTSGSMTLSVVPTGPNPTRIEVPDSLPMAPQQAQALLARLPDQNTNPSLSSLRWAYFGVRLAIAGFERGRHGYLVPELETRSIGLFEDPLLTRAIHDFAVEAQEAQQTMSVNAVPLLPHLPNLYAMRDIDDFMDDKGIVSAAKYLINLEQAQAKSPFRNVTGKCSDKLSVFEWATARPELANGPLLDVLMQPGADWSFLDNETRYGLVPDHCVELIVFPREKVAGRAVDFAVSELAPVYRKSLNAAIAELPATVYINRRLPVPAYDFSRKVLTFESQPDGSYGSRAKPPHMLGWASGSVEYLGLGEESTSTSMATVRAPKDAEGLAFYSLEMAVSDNESIGPPRVQPASVSATQHGEDWRNSVRFFSGDGRDRRPRTLAVDHLLGFPEVPLDPATAERLITDVQGSYDKAMRAIIVLDVDDAESVADYPAVLYTRLKQVVIATHDGREVAVLDAASFPDAVVSYRQASAKEQDEREAASRAAAAKDAAQKASLDEARASREAALAACDTNASTAMERLPCYQAFCASTPADYECAKQVRYAQIQADAEKSLATD